MASETAEGNALTVSLPSDLDEWLDGRADELGVDRDAVLVQLLAAYRVAADVEDGPAVDDLQDRIARENETVAAAVERALDSEEVDLESHIDLDIEGEIEPELSELRSQLEAVEGEFDEKIEDVRSRVLQLKRQTEEKAAKDHTHDELEQLPEVLSQFESLRTTVGELQTVLQEGAFEERIDAVETETKEVRGRLNTLASAVVALRSRVAAAASSRQDVLTDIRQRAAAEGINTAACDNCENTVSVGLLGEPTCPHCGADYADIEPPGGFLFGTATLVTDRPQLEEGDREEGMPDAAEQVEPGADDE